MTLSMAVITKDFVASVTDRRVSNGRMIGSEEHDKTFALSTDDANLAVSFSGLATVPGFDTHKWLLNATYKAGAPSFCINDLVEGLTAALTIEFHNNPLLRKLPRSSIRLSVMLVGYQFIPDPVAIYGVISNYEDHRTRRALSEAATEFMLFRAYASDVPVTINLRGLCGRDFLSLRRDADRIGPTSCVWRLASLVRKASGHSASQRSIGKQLTSMIMTRDAPSIRMNYHSARIRRGAVMPAIVHAHTDSQWVISGIRIEPSEIGAPDMSVPFVGRNKPCPCRSGKRFKICHGATF